MLNLFQHDGLSGVLVLFVFTLIINNQKNITNIHYMKHIFTIALFSMIYTSVFAQYEKVLLNYGSLDKPRWILNCTDDTQQDCILQSFYPDRSVQGEAKIAKMGGYFRPIGDMIIYFPNGKVFQEYDHKTGTLLTYYPTGELEEKMITPINGDIEYKYKYYKTGQVWEEEQAKREPGKQNLSYGHSNNRDKIYDNTGYSYNYFKTFHPNGNLQSIIFIDVDAPTFRYAAQYYSPEGQLDTFSNYTNRYGKRIDKGYRYDYHSNGQLREISFFDEYGQISGEQYRWAENGQLVWKTQYLNGNRQGKLETWWENGKRKEVGYYNSSYKAGPILKWHHDGKLIEQGSYFAGEPVGIATIWDTLGNLRSEQIGVYGIRNLNQIYQEKYGNDRTIHLVSEGNFKDNVRDGEWKFYYKKQNKTEPTEGLYARVTYKNGLLDGKAWVYYPNGNLCMEANFREGMLEGEYVAMKEAGYVSIKGNFEKNKKNGIWTVYFHEKNQIHLIEKYVDNANIENYGEWETDGFQKRGRIDNAEKQQVEYYDYYKSGMKLMHVIPYGRKNMDTYEYDTSGYLKKTRILFNDNPQSNTQTQYYPNGQRASQLFVINGKREGIYWAWYEDGRMKTEVHFENNLQQGESISWDENGNKTVKYFQKGIEIIPHTAEEEAIECSCNRPPDEVVTRFMQWFLDYVDYEKVKKRTPYYTISETSYKRLFAKSIQQYDNRIWGELAVINDFYVDVHNGLRLNFTPCRRGANRAALHIEGDYDENQNIAEVVIKDFDLTIEFPKTLLLPYDVENQRLLQTSIEKYQTSGVRFKVKKMTYSDDGKTPVIEMKTEETPCFQISEIGQTGILFNANDPKIDFSPTAAVDLPWENFKYDPQLDDLLIDDENFILPNKQYLNGFIGVYFPTGKLYLPFEDSRLTVDATHILISGMEIYGNMEIISNEKIALSEVKNYLETKGFEVLNENLEDNEILRIFWRYVK